ncbi:MAG: transglutaminase-like domain-containing protein [Firmicutes bacterium]|nr:transglutaminase-like domain-containing protein [Bacillota bacterium]
MKKIVFTFIIVLSIMSFMSVNFADSQLIKVNTDGNTVSVNYNTSDYSKVKVVIKKDDAKYVYNLSSDDEKFPLQMGAGKYEIGLYKHVKGKKYSLITSEKFSVKSSDVNNVYLSSVQNVSWNSNSLSTKIARKLTENASTDMEKVSIIYNYVVNNIEYDYAKADSVKAGYIPDNTRTINSNQGICYDYASLTASMLRSVGVPTKLVKGTSNNTSVYHAWNEVLVDGKWIVIDTTIDSELISDNVAVDMLKNPSDYFATKMY